MKLYIAGPMTGLPDHNFPAFFDAEAQLEAAGFGTINPAGYGVTPGYSWADCLRRDLIAFLQHAEGVALLQGWARSPGARLERHVSVALGLPTRPLAEWLTRKETE